MNRHLRLFVATLFIFAAGNIGAADFPNHLIKVVVPYPAGGVLDVAARIIFRRVSESLAQPIMIENRPGAGTIIGSKYVAQSTPDGYTLLMTLEAISALPSVYANLPFDPVKDFEPITLLFTTQWVLVANPSLPVPTLAELVAYAKARPGQLNYGSTGIGGSNHFNMEQFERAAGIQMLHIPYPGGPPAFNALLSGEVHTMLMVGPVAIPYIQTGKVRPLAITGTKRASSLPMVPTLREAGYPGFERGAWTALFAPKNTPREVVQKLNKEVRKVLDQMVSKHEVNQFYVEDFQIPQGNTPEEMATIVRDDVKRWHNLAEQIGIKPQ